MSTLDYVDLAARHGFAGIDIPSLTAVMKTGGASSLRDALAAKGIAPVIFGLAPEMGLEGVEWRKDEETFRHSLVTLAPAARFAQELGLTRCYTYLPPAVDTDSNEYENLLARRLREISCLLGEHGIRLGMEWLGPRHLRAEGTDAMGANPFIFSMERTLTLIEKISVPTVGLILDSLHAYTTGIGGKEISSLAADQIVHVHLSDVVKGQGRVGARSDQRLLPGAGEVDLAGLLRGLRAIGYDGYAAVEVIAPENIAETPDESAIMIRSSLRKLGI